MRKRLHTRVDRQSRADELLDAAIAVIRRDGPTTSMERIATQAGITKPVLYRYFGDKAGIYEAVAQRYMTELRDGLVNSMRPDAPPRVVVERTIDTYVATIEREPQVYKFLIQQAHLSSTNPEAPVESFIRQVAGQVTIVVAESLRANGYDISAAEPMGFGITGMVQLAADWWIERPSMSRSRLVAHLTALTWDGIGDKVDAADSLTLR